MSLALRIQFDDAIWTVDAPEHGHAAVQVLASRCPKDVAELQGALESGASLSIDGLSWSGDTQSERIWTRRTLKHGDRITVEVVGATEFSPSKIVAVGTAAEIRQARFEHFLELKREFEDGEFGQSRVVHPG